MILPIYVEPQAVLHRGTTPVSKFDDALREKIAAMRETMENAEGIGLAAPQVGDSRSFFIVEYEPDNLEEEAVPFTVVINPEILWRSPQKTVMEEACLSIPGVLGDVKRPRKLVMRYKNEHGKTVEKTFSGLFARVVQHEFDHLRGVLFTDYVPQEQRRSRTAPEYPRI